MGLAPATDRPRSGGLAAVSELDTLTPKRHISRDLRAGDSALGCSLFARRYSGNPSWFLFLRLFICLNSAGRLA